MTEDTLEYSLLKWRFIVKPGLWYNENDCWARVEGDVAYVGITDFLQTMVGDIIFVEFKKTGTGIGQMEEVASFESTKTMLDLISPVSGVIEAVNTDLVSHPDVINQDPYGGGWFAKLRLSRFKEDQEFLLDARSYFEVMKQKAEKEKANLGKEG